MVDYDLCDCRLVEVLVKDISVWGWYGAGDFQNMPGLL